MGQLTGSQQATIAAIQAQQAALAAELQAVASDVEAVGAAVQAQQAALAAELQAVAHAAEATTAAVAEQRAALNETLLGIKAEFGNLAAADYPNSVLSISFTPSYYSTHSSTLVTSGENTRGVQIFSAMFKRSTGSTQPFINLQVQLYYVLGGITTYLCNYDSVSVPKPYEEEIVSDTFIPMGAELKFDVRLAASISDPGSVIKVATYRII